ncbi:MAG: thioredoxin domain-containing protein [Proteobacteria bacterium]|nr:thioredoxin domain-containing protein [Pseudomonadota bacterium]MBU4295799.1 thioredoxin domain-containing protein [Pseudomonadota bacterium]MCG2747823.1 thioredoxin domain-containing protein [Desulfobulbaceae bacterium]
MEKQPPYTRQPNRLINEKSPYLLQHAYNPVQWLPWGEEAFARASRDNKPIFLSIGYSTCHWCHVMAHESFEDEEIAACLNDFFICIKVDREERPDIDRIYMAATQALTGGGGWPMSVFLLPDRTPFYAGTYFPPRAGLGRPGFLDLLQALHQAWQDDPGRIRQAAASMATHLQSLATADEQGKVEAGVLDAAFHQLSSSYDRKFGGFGQAPKFPRPVAFYFLLRYGLDRDNSQARTMTLKTLRRMAEGGMYDLLGGGFHRYSVDEQWRVPHFEKMLYDQALLALAYFEAFQLSGDLFFRRIGTETLDYVLRDMTNAQGGFFSAEDADSAEPDDPQQHGEGAFYTWKAKQIAEVLDNETAAIFNFRYGVEALGNALADPLDEFTGKNILYTARTLAETAAHCGRSEDDVAGVLAAAREQLALVRAKRPRPHLDDKVLCAWNGLMISALAKGYQVTGNRAYLQGAQRSADFILATLYDREKATLRRRYRQGEAGLAAQLDDYAFFVQGLLDLYAASFTITYLQNAIALTHKQIELFADKAGGGFFETTDQDASLLLRMKGDYDGAEPASNSVAALNLLRLAPFVGQDWRQRAGKTIDAFASQLNRYPTSMPLMLVALDFSRQKPAQIIIVGHPGAPDTRAMIAAVHAIFLPHTMLLLADDGPGQQFLGEKIPSLAGLTPQHGKACAYVCRNLACSLPTTDIEALVQMLREGS